MAAKGRRLTTSRSERYLGSYGYGGSQGTTATDEAELVEEEIWSVGDAADDGSHCADATRDSPRFSRSRRHLGGLSVAFAVAFEDYSSSPRIVHQSARGNVAEEGGATSRRAERPVAASAPVNVPDWSKIYRVTSVESIHDSDDEGDSEMVPPHVYVARSHARNGRSSVLEGVGRTLKGRDMTRVRDAVWRQTGFCG